MLIANGRSIGDRGDSRVTVTTGGSGRAVVSCADANDDPAATSANPNAVIPAADPRAVIPAEGRNLVPAV
jgi:hypothetical protein